MHRPTQPAVRLLPPFLLLLVCYVPLLLTAPGVVVADTKSYLYLDPGRLLSRAWSMWDPSTGAGTVTHQNIGYLWPAGPWYWTFDRLGAPDWVAQRLWLGTILAAAGFGVVWMLRTLAWRGPEVWTAAFLYALTPYVLTVAARISILLVPFAALPWMIAFTERSLRERGWRWPAVFALTVTTAGSVNLTALVLCGVGPLLWIVYSLAARVSTFRSAAATVLRFAALTIPVSLWWLAGLWVQAGWGIDILQFTETAKVVAQASTANEVLRGLGYWFFYGGDKLGPWIEPSFTYTQKLLVLTLSYGIPVVGLGGLALTRFRRRGYFALLALAGVVLAVGAHPWDHPTLEGRALEAFLQSNYGLAMRSLPRAVPLVALALAVGVAALTTAVARWLPRLQWFAVLGVMTVAVANLPTLWTLKMVPANLRRPETIPSYWMDAARWFDAQGSATRVLEIPGADFASYRWGNTVDPVLPGLMDRGYVSRELIPYGTPPSADLLIALDHRLQERILDPRGLAPIARLLNAGDISVRSDLQYERYNTPRPVNLWQLVNSSPGLGDPVGFGSPSPNIADPGMSLFDGLYLQTPPTWPDPPPVAAFPVQDAPAILRVQDARTPLIVAGDGEGLVDAAEGGLLTGNELILYSASSASDPAQLRQRAAGGAVLVVTDSNRRRGRRWTSVRHNAGETTPAGQQPLVTDLTNNALPVFNGAGDATKTVIDPSGGVRAQASSYGNSITFTPEDRAANAIDGDPNTAWRTAAFGKAVGERLQLTYDEPVTADNITLLQPITGEINRSITKVRIRFDGGSPLDATLGPSSNAEPGQRIDFPSRTFTKLDIEILADSAGSPPRYGGLTSEGFAEVRVGSDTRRLEEVVRPPTDLLGTLASASNRNPLVFLFARQRSTPTDPTRGDEELHLIRAIETPTRRSFAVSGTARIDAGAPDAVLDSVLGTAGAIVSSSAPRLQGDITARASATIDGDPATAWTGRFDQGSAAWLEYRTPSPVTADSLTLTVRADGAHSVPTEVHLIADGRDLGPLSLPPVADRGPLNTTATVAVALPAPTTASTWRLQVTAVRTVETVSWDSGNGTAFPVSIAEVGLGAMRGAVPAGPGAAFDSGCRSDLVTVDGAPVPVRISGPSSAAIAGGALAVQACGGPVDLAPGRHVLRTAEGVATGIDLDQLVLRSAAGGGADTSTGLLSAASGSPGARVQVTSDGRYAMSATVTGATAGTPMWLVLGQSFSNGWQATIDGRSAGAPSLLDGYANGWLVTPERDTFTVALTFAPQRTVNLMLVLSAVAAVGCVVLALLGSGKNRRRSRMRDRAEADRAPAREPGGDGGPGGAAPQTAGPRRARRADVASSPDAVVTPRVVWLDRSLDLRGWTRRVLTAVLAGAIGAVIAGPPVGLALGVLVFVATLGPRGRLVLRLASPSALALAGAYVVVQQVRHRTAPGLEWPNELERAHPLGWLAILTLAADAALAHLARVAPPRRSQTAMAEAAFVMDDVRAGAAAGGAGGTPADPPEGGLAAR